MPGTHVTTTLQKFIVVVTLWKCIYDCADIYRDEEEEEEEGGGELKLLQSGQKLSML